MGKTKKIEKLFLHITIYSYLILPLSLFFCKKRKGFPFVIAIYGVVAFILLRIFDYLTLDFKPLYVLSYTLFEYLFFTYFIFTSIKNKKIKKLILFFSFCFTLFQAVTYFSNSKAFRLDSVSVGIETILLFIYILFFFYEYFKNTEPVYIYNQPASWLSIGILIYLGGSFFSNILVNYMSDQEFNNYWHYTYIAEIIKNLLFAVAILVASRHRKRNANQSQPPHWDADMD